MDMFRKSLYVTLIVAVALCGCATPVVTINPKVNLPQSVPQVQLTVGVYQSPEFRSYEPIANLYSFPVGQASASLFQELFPKVFKKVVWVEGPPSITTVEMQLSAVIEPRIDEFQVFMQVLPTLAGGVLKVWAEIHYGFTVYSPDGVVLASWTVKGVGESTGGLAMSRAVNYAMQEAAWRFITSFNEVPEAKRWVQRLPQQGAIADKTEQTTRPDPGYAEGAVLGTYPNVVAVSADTNTKPEGQSAEVHASLKTAGLLAIRVLIKNQGSNRLLLRRRDISLARTDGTVISSLPASTFAVLGVKPRAVFGSDYYTGGLGALPFFIADWGHIESERKDREANLSIYRDKELYDATLTKGRSVQGYIYFVVPEGGASLEDLKLVVPVIDFDAATWYIVRLPMTLP